MENVEYRILDGKKLREFRGGRTLAQIKEASANLFSEQLLSAYELGKAMPDPMKVPYLLAAYGAPWVSVSSPVEVELAA